MNSRWRRRYPIRCPPLEGYTFEGYRNPDGSVGTKNILGIATTVQCVAPTVEYAARRIRTELLPRFPNVDDVVPVTHSYGCGVAIDAPGAAVPIRTLKAHLAARQHGGAADGGEPGLRETAAGAAVRQRTADTRRGQRDPPAGPARVRGDGFGDSGSRGEAAGATGPAAADLVPGRRIWWWGCNAAAATVFPA